NNGMMIGRPTSEELPSGYRQLDQVSVLSITDSEGSPVYTFSQPDEVQVVEPAYAYMVTDILSRDAINWSRLTIDRPAASKTGTSEEYRDGVLMGYTPDLAVGVWMGNADNSPMAVGTYSSVGSGPIWRIFMEEAHAYLELEPRPFEEPDDVSLISCGGRSEIFKVGTPTVKAGGCRGPSGPASATATPSPRGPRFPPTADEDTPTPTPTPDPGQTESDPSPDPGPDPEPEPEPEPDPEPEPEPESDVAP
ncbi:MAG: hypothetical protein O7A04_04300, partial [Acidobacteria bacterium]|nr:hypothetical protein [Acidobacteriota bacterium]